MTPLGAFLIVVVFAVLVALWAWGESYGRRKLARARRVLAEERRAPLGRTRIGL